MKIDEAKNKFIQTWGSLGSQWGINKAMAQIHALLMISEEDLSAEEIMETLQMSRGNVNMNVRALIEWGIVFKAGKPGERKDYFTAEKDIGTVARKIARERRKREIEPVLTVFEDLKVAQKEGNKEDWNSFDTMLSELEDFTGKMDSVLDKFTRSDRNWFYKTLLKKM